MFREIVVKFPSVEFHENTTKGIRVLTCLQTDGQRVTTTCSSFSQLRTHLKTTSFLVKLHTPHISFIYLLYTAITQLILLLLQHANFQDTGKSTQKHSRLTPNWNQLLLILKNNWGMDQMGLQNASDNETARSVNPVQNSD